MDIYIVSKWEGVPRLAEIIKPEWYDDGNLPWDRTWADNRVWLPLVLAGRQVDATFLLSDDNRLAEYTLDVAG